MISKKIIRSAAVVAMAILGAESANAAQYLISYTSNHIGGDSSLFSATLTTTDVADRNGFFQVTGFAGTRNGIAATLIPLYQFMGNDNLFKNTPNYFSFDGLSYKSGGTIYNVYFAGPNVREANHLDVSNLVVTPVNAAVPEPATWAMMLLGFGGIGAAMRRRRAARIVRFA